MVLTHLDHEFIKFWKETDFTDWNEADIREEFISPLLGILKYSKNTLNAILREKELKLSKPYQRIGRKAVQIDYIPTIKLKYFWIIEAKPGSPKEMDFGDFSQAYLYANHPEVKTQLIVLINGWEVRIYDAVEAEAWDDTIFICNKDNCHENFESLKKILSSKTMILSQRARIFDLIESTFSIEIDQSQLDHFMINLNPLLQQLKKQIRKNEKEFRLQVLLQDDSEYRKRLSNEIFENIIEEMNIPTLPSQIAANEIVERIKRSNEKVRIVMLIRLREKYMGKTHTIFKTLSVYILAKLLKEGIVINKSDKYLGLKQELEDLINSNINYWDTDNTIYAVNHYDNTTLRVSKKLAHRLYLRKLNDLIEDLKKSISKEDFISKNVSLVGEMISMYRIIGTLLWNDFSNSSSPLEIWDGVWLCEYLETILNILRWEDYPDDDRDLLFFELYGKQFDMLYVGTWDVLNKLGQIHDVLSKDIMDFIKLDRKQIISQIPQPNEKSADWGPPLEKYKDKNIVKFIKLFIDK